MSHSSQNKKTQKKQDKIRLKNEGFVKINIWNLYSKILTTITKM